MLICLLGSLTARLSDSTQVWANESAIEPVTSIEQTQADCPIQQSPAELLSAIRVRIEKLDDQEMQLAESRKTLTIVEMQAEERISELKSAEAKLAATLAIAESAAEEDLTKLTSVYENMKPKSASDIFAAMDVKFAAGFIARMRPDAAAEIMAGMPADRAYAISLTIAGRNSDAPIE